MDNRVFMHRLVLRRGMREDGGPKKLWVAVKNAICSTTSWGMVSSDNGILKLVGNELGQTSFRTDHGVTRASLFYKTPQWHLPDLGYRWVVGGCDLQLIAKRQERQASFGPVVLTADLPFVLCIDETLDQTTTGSRSRPAFFAIEIKTNKSLTWKNNCHRSWPKCRFATSCIGWLPGT